MTPHINFHGIVSANVETVPRDDGHDWYMLKMTDRDGVTHDVTIFPEDGSKIVDICVEMAKA